jgi:cysteine synthase A
MGRTGVLSAIGRTPLLQLARLAPPGGARVFLKWEGANPTGSMKDRMALAMVGTALGHRVRIVAYDVVAEEKIGMMRALGAEVEILATPGRKVTPWTPV